jgi:hypothetical protein
MIYTVSALAIRDRFWLGGQLDAAVTRCGSAERPVLGVLWWYTASEVLVRPSIETLLAGDRVADPELANLTLHVDEDSRLRHAEADRPLPDVPDITATLGRRIAAAMAPAISAVATVSGARERPLWAIAADALANVLLSEGAATGELDRATALAGPIAAAAGLRMPRPRYVDVEGRRFVRRCSCCLLYQATGGFGKCPTCPRQRPEQRRQRLLATSQ